MPGERIAKARPTGMPQILSTDSATEPEVQVRVLGGWVSRLLGAFGPCSRLEPMKKVARMLRAHEPLILNWFRAKGEISSGAVPGARGPCFRNWLRFEPAASWIAPAGQADRGFAANWRRCRRICRTWARCCEPSRRWTEALSYIRSASVSDSIERTCCDMARDL
jgi:hypothetical protein